MSFVDKFSELTRRLFPSRELTLEEAIKLRDQTAEIIAGERTELEKLRDAIPRLLLDDPVNGGARESELADQLQRKLVGREETIQRLNAIITAGQEAKAEADKERRLAIESANHNGDRLLTAMREMQGHIDKAAQAAIDALDAFQWYVEYLPSDLKPDLNRDQLPIDLALLIDHRLRARTENEIGLSQRRLSENEIRLADADDFFSSTVDQTIDQAIRAKKAAA